MATKELRAKTEEEVAKAIESTRQTIKNVDGAFNKVLLCAYRGLPVREIVKETGVTLKVVRSIRYSKPFEAKLKEMGEHVSKRIIEIEANSTALSKARLVILESAYQAAVRLEEISKIGTEKDKMQFMACVDILDRAGLKPKDTTEIIQRQYTPEEIRSMNTTLREVENVTMRLSNKDSEFVLSKTKEIPFEVQPSVSSSVTEEAPVVPTERLPPD